MPTFASVTGEQDADVAKIFMEEANQDMNRAVEMYLDPIQKRRIVNASKKNSTIVIAATWRDCNVTENEKSTTMLVQCGNDVNVAKVLSLLDGQMTPLNSQGHKLLVFKSSQLRPVYRVSHGLEHFQPSRRAIKNGGGSAFGVTLNAVNTTKTPDGAIVSFLNVQTYPKSMQLHCWDVVRKNFISNSSSTTGNGRKRSKKEPQNTHAFLQGHDIKFMWPLTLERACKFKYTDRSMSLAYRNSMNMSDKCDAKLNSMNIVEFNDYIFSRVHDGNWLKVDLGPELGTKWLPLKVGDKSLFTHVMPIDDNPFSTFRTGFAPPTLYRVSDLLPSGKSVLVPVKNSSTSRLASSFGSDKAKPRHEQVGDRAIIADLDALLSSSDEESMLLSFSIEPSVSPHVHVVTSSGGNMYESDGDGGCTFAAPGTFLLACRVCFETKEFTKYTKRFCFQHIHITGDHKQLQDPRHPRIICGDCVEQHAKAALSSGKLYVKCPAEGCGRSLQTIELEQIVDRATYNKLVSRISEAEALQESSAESASNIQAMLDAGLELRQCPRCRVIIEKNEGCNSMQCYRCGEHFSWSSATLVEVPTAASSGSKSKMVMQLLWSACNRGDLDAVERLLKRYEGDLNVNFDGKCTPLCIASQKGHAPVVELLLAASDIDVNQAKTKNGATPLFLACQNGHKPIVELLLASSVIAINQARTTDGGTPLCIACYMGHTHVVELLLAASSTNVNEARTDNGATALVMACQKEHTSVVELLLTSSGINVNQAKTTNGCTPLFIACQLGNAPVVELLLASSGIAVNQAETEFGFSPLFTACTKGHTPVVKLLLASSGINVNQGTTNRTTPLWMASQEGHAPVVELLLAASGTDVNQADTDNGRTPLYIASGNGHAPVVELLLASSEIAVNQAATKDGSTPLYWACSNGHAPVVELLLASSGIAVNQITTTDGSTPLFWACSNGHAPVVELLLASSGIDVNQAETKFGFSPLLIACKKGCLTNIDRPIDLLLQHDSIDVNQAAKDGTFPLSLACSANNIKIAQSLLRSSSINVNQTINGGLSTLYIACQNGHTPVVELLLQQIGIAVNQANKAGFTPLFIACQNGHAPVVDRLLQQDSIDVNQTMNDGATALFMACEKGHAEVVQRLLSVDNIDVGLALATNGCTNVFIACSNAHMHVLAHLLSHPKTNPNQPNSVSFVDTFTFIFLLYGYLEKTTLFFCVLTILFDVLIFYFIPFHFHYLFSHIEWFYTTHHCCVLRVILLG